MSDYPPADDRLKHLLAQEINLSVDTWKLAFWIADGIVKDPAIRAELERIAAAHGKGQPCGDRHCEACFANAHAEAEQPPQASHSKWRVETLDPIANEWAPSSALPSLEAARQRLAQAQQIAPKWRDDKTPVARRIVRETVTYAVEAEG
ncbi:hypothetical protein ABZY44_21890 [Streptomyces sp. NPDC006544]|uniref:hypothetical protein n=1 Tax=Streptomyces sp. NPDC006544 TaxID=3154583 RepID=UPI00339EA698